MKKFILMVVMMAGALIASAQSVNDQMAKIQELCVKLDKALQKTPKNTGETDVDAYVAGCKTSAAGAVASAAQLQDFYKRQIGETVDGVTDVTVTKPTMEDWLALSTTIGTQAAGAAELGVAAKTAAESVKKVKGPKAIALTKSVKWSTDIMPIIVEAMAEEGKAIAKIIETLKSGQNL